MSLVHLIRHGEPVSGWGEPNGDADPGLTDLGRRQAEAAAVWLNRPDLGSAPRRILSSPLRRCQETAAVFAQCSGLPVTLAPAVAEVPTPPGLSGAERGPWLRDAMAGEWSTMEGIDGLAWRRSVAEALLEAQDTAVFTHFVAINAAVATALQSAAVLTFRPAPGSVTTLRIEGGRLHVERLGHEIDGEGRVL